MADPQQLKTAISHVLLSLKNNAAPKVADVRKAAIAVVGLMNGMGITIDTEELVNHVEATIHVHPG